MCNCTIRGFHGTNSSNAGKILESGFHPSHGDEHWLGDGVYFFTDGLGNPQLHAERYAKLKAWDKQLGRYTYDKFAVIRVDINVHADRMLDLTASDGIELLDFIQAHFRDKLTRRLTGMCDGILINFARNEIGMHIDVVKGNVYIKLEKRDRTLNISRRTPNCTICAVYKAESITDKVQIKEGELTNET